MKKIVLSIIGLGVSGQDKVQQNARGMHIYIGMS